METSNIPREIQMKNSLHTDSDDEDCRGTGITSFYGAIPSEITTMSEKPTNLQEGCRGSGLV